MQFAKLNEQMLSMHLVHQEVLIEIIYQLHQKGMVDAK